MRSAIWDVPFGNNVWGPEAIADGLKALVRRSSAARAAGGIALEDAVDGAFVPNGWVLDYETDYYLPPNVVLVP